MHFSPKLKYKMKLAEKVPLKRKQFIMACISSSYSIHFNIINNLLIDL